MEGSTKVDVDVEAEGEYLKWAEVPVDGLMNRLDCVWLGTTL